MDKHENLQGSEVARILAQIQQEYESATNGLYGLSEGNARHAFISAKYDRIGTLQEKLEKLVGERKALEIVVEMTIGGGNGVNQTTQAAP